VLSYSSCHRIECSFFLDSSGHWRGTGIFYRAGIEGWGRGQVLEQRGEMASIRRERRWFPHRCPAQRQKVGGAGRKNGARMPGCFYTERKLVGISRVLLMMREEVHN
jgi:hypothetical protein